MTTSQPREVGSPLRVRDWVLAACRFRDEKARAPVPFEGTLFDLVGAQHLPRVSKKGTIAFSPVRYREGATRGKRGIVDATALVLDFDHLTSEAAEEVAQRIARRGWAFVAYTSFSHAESGDDDCCFRVALPVSRPIRPAEYAPVWDAVNGALGRLADEQARDISRIWFVASCPPERMAQAWMRHGDGRPVDVDGALEAGGGVPSRRPRRKRGGDGGEKFAAGGRNAGLMSLGGGLRRRGASREELVAFLASANLVRCEPPLEADEVEAIADSLLRYDPASKLLTLNRTDAGNAERFLHHGAGRFAFVHAWGTWLHFDGRRWERDGTGEAMRVAIDALRTMAREAEAVPDEDERGELTKHALDSEASARLSAMTSVAQALAPITTDDLDRDPDLLNVLNGTLDLRTGELRPHAREDWLTRLVPVAYDPAATCPRWEAFLHRVMGGNGELVAFLQRAVGYALTGHTSEQSLFLLYGIGANGKSTFLETVRVLLADYATIADFGTFLKRDNEGARNDLARLVGTRFVSAVEAEAGRPLAEALVKQLTGGDTITARFLFKEFFDFKPQFKIWLAANHKPQISGSDHGIWRRIRLVPFTVTIPEPERDPKLTAKLAEELAGILAWAVRGCLAWREHGLGVPDEVRSATDAYREEMDVFGGFLEEGVVADGGAVVSAKELNAAYAAWCDANGERARSAKALANALRERGFENTRLSKGTRAWRGLRLRRDDEPMQPAGDGWRMGDASPGNSSQIPSDAHVTTTSGTARRDLAEDPEQASPTATRHPSGTRHPADGWEEGEL